jgi:class 3 adenylate cyclase
MALAMLAVVERTNRDLPVPLQMRIGIHSGDVVAGVIGTHKFVYDVWGRAVNIASRMESHGVPNRIMISEATHDRIRGLFRVEPHGTVDVKGIGPMKTFILCGSST